MGEDFKGQTVFCFQMVVAISSLHAAAAFLKKKSLIHIITKYSRLVVMQGLCIVVLCSYHFYIYESSQSDSLRLCSRLNSPALVCSWCQHQGDCSTELMNKTQHTWNLLWIVKISTILSVLPSTFLNCLDFHLPLFYYFFLASVHSVFALRK